MNLNEAHKILRQFEEQEVSLFGDGLEAKGFIDGVESVRAEIDRLKEENENLMGKIAVQMKGDRLTYLCKCGTEKEVSPIPMYESQIKELQSNIKQLCIDQQKQIGWRDSLIDELAGPLKSYWSLLQRFYDADKQMLPLWDDEMFKEQNSVEEALKKYTTFRSGGEIDENY